MTKSDRQLIDASIHRDERAFAELFDRYAPTLYRFALSLSRVPQDAQELTQQTFITAWKRLADIRLVGTSMLPWLLVACRNHHLNLRRSLVARAVVPLELVPAQMNSADSGSEAREELRAITDAIQRLDDIDRSLITLCVVEGRSYAEASASLGMSTSTLAKRMERARQRLSRVRMEYRKEVQS